MAKFFYIFLIACPILYLLVLLVVYVLQDRLIFIPFREINSTPAMAGWEFEDLLLPTEDQAVVSAWWIPAPSERGVLLYCHGNAGNISHRLAATAIFRDLGLSVLLFDYRGYGKSKGILSEQGTYRDAETAWNYLIEVKKRRPKQILLFGKSLGGAIAAEMALRHRPGGLILQSSFTSLPDMAAGLFPLMPARYLVKYKYATEEKIGSIACPTLIVHSQEDEIVPFAQGRILFAKAAEPKRFLTIQGDHNQGFLTSGDTYRKGISDFLDLCFSPPNAP